MIMSVKQDRPGKEQVQSAGWPQMKVNRKHASTSCSHCIHSSCLPLSLTHRHVSDREKESRLFVALFDGSELVVSDVKLTWRFFSPVSSPAIRRYGKDFAAIAEVIGTKTPAQVSILFFMISHLLFWPQSNPPSTQQFTLCELPISFSSFLQFPPHPSVWIIIFLYRITIISIIPPFICLLTSSLLERSPTFCPPSFPL